MCSEMLINPILRAVILVQVYVCAQTPYTLAILYIGAPACGMNAAARAFVRMGLTQGCKVLGIRYGFEGLMQNDVSTAHTDC